MFVPRYGPPKSVAQEGEIMDRRYFLLSGASFAGVAAMFGCRGQQVGEVMHDNKKDLVGSRAAGGEIYKPLIEEALAKLLGRQHAETPVIAGVPAKKRICFVGLENKSSEELGDFKAMIVETIDNKINQSGVFEQISQRYTQAGLTQTRLRPDELFIKENQRKFLAVMESGGNPFDYLLFATVTSGTTVGTGSNSQKEYMLTLELVNMQSGTPDKESATLRKAYHKSHGL
jgi:hypothetical protein